MKREPGSAWNRVPANRPYLALAEGVGFEPTVGLPPQRFSRPSQSSTLAPLRVTAAAIGYCEDCRNSLKNRCNSSLTSSARTPLVTWSWWLRRGERTMSSTDPAAPALGSSTA